MTSATITRAFSEGIAAAIPQAELSISQWAETYRHIAAERSARPGRWRNAVVPYLAEVMDTVRQPGVRETVLVASAQVGKSECCNNVIGYFAHIEPSPIIYLCEEQSKAEAWSKESFAPMVRDTPVLAALFGDPRQRDGGNTIEGKTFPGGHLAIAWATSPATLSSRPRRVVIMDERDAFKPTGEGDPAKLAEKRATTFPDAVIFKVSTPRDRLENPPDSPPDAPRFSPIELEYENSDKRRYHVPCPTCGAYQALVWKNVVFDHEDPLAAVYMCAENGCVIEHEQKAEMLARGRWVAELPFNGRAGFHIWEGYSPFVTWGEMARNWLEAKKSRDTLRVFVNTSLGEGWEDFSGQAEVSDLEARREDYGAEVPAGVLVVTASADTQGDRLETETVGWGLDGESWSLGYHVIEGDPARVKVWDDLKELWLTPLLRADGAELRVAAACVDSGGHHTDEVYKFCRENGGRKWRAVKGANTPGKPLVSKPSLLRKPGGTVRLYTVGTETAKDTLAARLLVTEPGPGYCHFPLERGGEYFKQLRSERPVVRAGVRRWEKVRQSARNEALDVRVYNMAALAILNPNWKALARRRAPAPERPPEISTSESARRAERELRDALDAAAEAQAAREAEAVRTSAHEEPEPEPERPRRRKGRRKRGGWVNNW